MFRVSGNGGNFVLFILTLVALLVIMVAVMATNSQAPVGGDKQHLMNDATLLI